MFRTICLSWQDVYGCPGTLPLRGSPGELKKAMLGCILLLLSIWQLTNAVTVRIITGMSDMSPVQICTNLLPGQCCQAIAAPIMNYFNPSYPSVVVFTNLSPLHIAAVWARRGNIRACSGVPIATRPGPGNWRHQVTGDERALGASYITLPTTLPPGETEANWLSAEGVLGFVWGGGRWFVKGAESLGESGTKKLKRRGMVRAEHGTVYAREPKRWKRPDVLVVNGTRYVDAETVDLVYQSDQMQVLNLTSSI